MRNQLPLTTTKQVLPFCLLLGIGQLGSQLMTAATNVLVTERVAEESSASAAIGIWRVISRAGT